MNILDFVTCVSITLNCLATLYFNDKAFVQTRGVQHLDAILVVVHIICILSIFVVFSWTSIENHFRRLSISAISNRVSQAIITLQQDVLANGAEFARMLDNGDKHLETDVTTFNEFKIATQRSLANQPSDNLLEATFFILKLVEADDDPHEEDILSPQMREQLASDTGVRTDYVRHFAAAIDSPLSALPSTSSMLGFV